MIVEEEQWHTTKAEHQRMARAFTLYCVAKGQDALPASLETFLGYLFEHAESWSARNILTTAASIRAWHERKGFDQLKGCKIDLAVENIARTASGQQPRPIRPLRPDELRMLVHSLGTRERDIRDRAMFLMMFAGMLRGEELLRLDKSDILWQKRGIVIYVSGPYRRVVTVVLLPGSPYCPVRALHAWLTRSPHAGSWLFPALHGNTHGRRLDNGSLYAIVKRRLEAVGICDRGTGVGSFRYGAIATAFDRNVEPTQIYRQAGFRRWLFVDRWREIRAKLHPLSLDDYLSQS